MKRLLPVARRTSLLATVAALSVLVAGCGASGGGTGSKQGELSMWTFKQSHVAAFQAAAEKFTAETGTKVNIQAYTPDDAFSTKIQAAARTNDLPDVMEVHAKGEDFGLGGAGLIADLSDDIDKEWLDRFIPQVREDGTIMKADYENSLAEGSKTLGVEEGDRYSVPITVGTQGMVYLNKDRAAKAGITEAPATWEDFIADLGKLKKEFGGKGGLTIGLKSPSTALEWIMQPMAYGLLGKERFQELFGKDASKGWSSAEGQKVLDTYMRVQPYWMPGSQTKTIDEADLAFAQGKASVDVGGTYTLAFLADNGYDVGNLMTFPVPPPAAAKTPDLQMAPFSLTGLSMTKKTRNKKEALEWMKFLSRPDIAALFGKKANDVPPNKFTDAQAKKLGPTLNSMQASFGTDPDGYNPTVTTYRPAIYDAGKVGAVLAQMTPLKTLSPKSTGSRMSSMMKSYWAEQG
ncbi:MULTISPECIES: ABC transporter substrate-binding protein [unclassified Streptomyces]|uniref:ABC transporter substrate-binding protein n=1 Tax=unclassified Streptomyces TaxID=2593676 RepID=UPI00081D7C51|nr:MULTISPECIES: extracellular solute-binding protein [unclassified Streptomyces]SCE24552.1 multiple sugar transport system substrate-binding protein [Streptomyces sp. SolWspMP-sol7th]